MLCQSFQIWGDTLHVSPSIVANISESLFLLSLSQYVFLKILLFNVAFLMFRAA